MSKPYDNLHTVDKFQYLLEIRDRYSSELGLAGLAATDEIKQVDDLIRDLIPGLMKSASAHECIPMLKDLFLRKIIDEKEYLELTGAPIV